MRYFLISDAVCVLAIHKTPDSAVHCYNHILRQWSFVDRLDLKEVISDENGIIRRQDTLESQVNCTETPFFSSDVKTIVITDHTEDTEEKSTDTESDTETKTNDGIVRSSTFRIRSIVHVTKDPIATLI